MIPMITSPTEARLAVSYSRFPPLGTRGQGSPFSGFSLGYTQAEYLKKANGEVLVIVQIEEKKGLEEVEEIAKVDGVGELERGNKRQ